MQHTAETGGAKPKAIYAGEDDHRRRGLTCTNPMHHHVWMTAMQTDIQQALDACLSVITLSRTVASLVYPHFVSAMQQGQCQAHL